VQEINMYEKKVRSQNGEDGMIEEIFRRIGAADRFFVEFGVQDGLECNTAHLSLDKDWSGLLIEGNERFYRSLCVNYAQHHKVRTAHQFVTRENIAVIFQYYAVPAEFDFLSVDIDGNDYWVWMALAAYRPRVVVIEYNAAFPPPRKAVIEYNPKFVWNGTSYFGASLSSLAALGKRLGYALVGADLRGVNAFFIREDLLDAAKFTALTPEEAYTGYWSHPWGAGPYLELN
jgi:hypothetical protein